MFVDVSWTDGRTIETIRLDARKDTPESVAFLTTRMKENGWKPIINGEYRPRIVGPVIGRLHLFVEAFRHHR